MGVRNNECILATTSIQEAVNTVAEWATHLSEVHRKQIIFAAGLVNNTITIILVPSGSKKGWDADTDTKHLRNEFISILESLAYDDGSNPFSWVEVGYGEYGQKILRGNNLNQYDDKPYALEN